MALTYICHICSTANEKLSEEMAFEIKITSPEKGRVGGRKSKKGKPTVPCNGQRVGACLLGKFLSLTQRGGPENPVRRREISPSETVAVFFSPGPQQAQILVELSKPWCPGTQLNSPPAHQHLQDLAQSWNQLNRNCQKLGGRSFQRPWLCSQTR